MSTIDAAIEKITAQQKGYTEEDNVFGVGEQLKDICRESEAIAELVLTDLDNPDMSIEKAEEQIEKKADEIQKKKGGKKVRISPLLADKLIRDFYGLPPKGEAPPKPDTPKIINLEDMM